MKLELIVPATQENIRQRKKDLCPPLGLAMVAALTPPEVQVSLTDENVTAIDLQKKTDMVGISATSVTAQRAYDIADTFRAKGIKVVMGGIHPSSLPEEAGRHADTVVIGEAEGIWPEVIHDFQAGKLQKLYRRPERPNLAGLPIPRRDLFARNAYHVPNTLSTTRGCPYSCSFCSVTQFFGHTYRCRPVDDVLRELGTFNTRKGVYFVDDNIVGNLGFARELFRALIPLKIKWGGMASVRIAEDEELLGLAAASGCKFLLIGFETLSPPNLAAIGKKVNVAEDYETIIGKIHSHGIAIHGFFMLGFDEDDEAACESTVRFAQKTRLESAQFNWPVPYPDTALYESLNRTGRIVTRDWARYEYDVVFEPKLMSREALKQQRYLCSREFFSLSSIRKRIGLKHSHLVKLWIANLAFYAYWRKRPYSRDVTRDAAGS